MNSLTRLTAAASVAFLVGVVSGVRAQEAATVTVASSGAPQTIQAALEKADVVGHSVETSRSGGTVTFDLANGERLRLALTRGRIRLNNETIGRYDVDGPLAEAWTDMLRDVQGLSSVEVLEAVQAWQWDFPETVMQIDVQQVVEAALASVAAAEAQIAAIEVTETPRAIAPRVEVVLPDVTVPEVTFDPAQFPPQAVGPPSVLGGMASNFLSLVASLVALTFMGFGYLFFAPRQLSSVADTAWHSFGRSFLTGLFAQPLLVPAFGAMIVGLALTVVGILVIPFAIPAFAAMLVLSVIGGYIALARSVGEIYLRRKGGIEHDQPGWMEFKYVFFGLLGLLSIWLPAVLLSWVPMAGTILLVTAALLTWVLATTGLGATILTRGGTRGTVVRRLDYALTDQRLWDTTPGITTSTNWKSRTEA
jgi:hypothetical protein